MEPQGRDPDSASGSPSWAHTPRLWDGRALLVLVCWGAISIQAHAVARKASPARRRQTRTRRAEQQGLEYREAKLLHISHRGSLLPSDHRPEPARAQPTAHSP